MKTALKRGWQIGIAMLSLVICYRLIHACDLSIFWYLLLQLFMLLFFWTGVGLVLWVFYFKKIYAALAISLPLKNLVFIFSSAYVLSRFSGILLNFIPVIFLSKKILKINYAQSISFPILEALPKAVLRIGLAGIGAVWLWNKGSGAPLRIGFVEIASVIVLILCLGLVIQRKGIRARLPKLIRDTGELVLHAKKEPMATAFLIQALILLVSALFTLSILNHFHYRYSLLLILGLQSIGFLAGIVSLLPMGIVSQDVAMVGLLMLIGVDKNVALSVTILDRLFTTGLPLIVCLFSINILSRVNLTDMERKGSLWEGVA